MVRQVRRSLLLMIMSTVVVSTFAMSAADRRPVQEYESWDEVPDPVRPGDMIHIVYTELKHRECPGMVYRWIQFSNQSIMAFDPLPVALSGAAWYDRSRAWPRVITVERDVRVPPDTPNRKTPRGDASYHARVTYYCNLVHQVLAWPIVTEAPPLRFKIVD